MPTLSSDHSKKASSTQSGAHHAGCQSRLPSSSGWLLKTFFVCCLLLLMAFSAIPLNAMSQLSMSLVVMAFVYAASTDALQHSRWHDVYRIIAILMSCTLSVRYLMWRGLYTMESEEILSLIAMWLLFAAELYSFVIHIIGCFINVYPLNRPERSLQGYRHEQHPQVDVVIPSYNEPAEMLEITLRAAIMLDYPADKLSIHLLDDGGTDQKINQDNQEAAKEALERRHQLQALCEKMGAHYHTRAKNEHAKAGNINSALVNMSGDLVVILDADHVPTTDFLSRTVPWMIDDDDVFLVQSPHFMINPDPVERNYFSAFDRMPSENDMFYGVIQKGLDFWSATFFCGSAAVLRRRHLDQVGGIAGDSITEDAETALELHSLGYKSVYVAKPMISGLAPETFASFIQQRIRWAQGMAQILFLKKPYLRKALSWKQRLGYMSSILFWFFPFARLVFLLSPLLYLLLDLDLINASLLEVCAYTIPHIIISFRLSHVLFGKKRWPLVSELYELLQCTFIFQALLTVIKNPRQPSFLVTPKGESLDKDSISSLSSVFYWLILLLFLGTAAGVYRLVETTTNTELTLIVLLWNSINLVLCLGLLEVLIEKRQLRKYSRLPAYDEVTLYSDDGDAWPGRLVDLSVDGARVRLDPSTAQQHGAPSHNPEHGELPKQLLLASFAHSIHTPVAIRCESRFYQPQRGEIAVQFVAQSDDEHQQIIAFTLGDSARWENFQSRRARHVSYYFGVKHVLSIGIKPLFTHIWMRLKQR